TSSGSAAGPFREPSVAGSFAFDGSPVAYAVLVAVVSQPPMPTAAAATAGIARLDVAGAPARVTAPFASTTMTGGASFGTTPSPLGRGTAIVNGPLPLDATHGPSHDWPCARSEP